MSDYTDLADWVEPASRAHYWVTKKKIQWVVGMRGSGLVVAVPESFTFDVSVPRLFWFLFSPDDSKFLKGACLHDYLLLCGWDRITAAAVFHDALQADGVGATRRLAMWLAVSLWKYK